MIRRMQDRLVRLAGLARSVRVYHGDRQRHRRMDALYRRFVAPGSLVFDIGAHVGDRVSSFRRLGARVVALEPQPGPAGVIALLHGRDRQVTLVRAAAGERIGQTALEVNRRNPTVSTASRAFVAAARDSVAWRGQVWDARLSVPMTTLDALVAVHGAPAFVKIDVEGYEDRVLAGLTGYAPAALSFELTTIARDVAIRCVDRLMALGDYRFDFALGESQSLSLGRWVTAGEIKAYLASLPDVANSGDVYARCQA